MSLVYSLCVVCDISDGIIFHLKTRPKIPLLVVVEPTRRRRELKNQTHNLLILILSFRHTIQVLQQRHNKQRMPCLLHKFLMSRRTKHLNGRYKRVIGLATGRRSIMYVSILFLVSDHMAQHICDFSVIDKIKDPDSLQNKQRMKRKRVKRKKRRKQSLYLHNDRGFFVVVSIHNGNI